MSVIDFLQNNWALVLVVAAMSVMILTTVHLNKSMTWKMFVIVFLILLLSVCTYIENYLWEGEVYNPLRGVLTAAKYFLPGLLVALIIYTFMNVRNFLLFVPAAICGTMCFASIFTKLVFGFSDANDFSRGPFGFLPFIVDGVYLLILAVLLVKNAGFRFNDLLPVIFLIVTTILTVLLPLIWEENFERWFCVTIAIDVFFYYVYLIQQLTKRDPLTGLMNRQCWYSDISRSGTDVTAVVSLDMNGLKKLNDTKGHEAGDKGITTISSCFKSSAKFSQRIYRVGGDEFLIMCLNNKEADVEKLVSRIRSEVEKTEYSCSIGYCMREKGMDPDDLVRIADERMYEEKRAHHAMRE